MLDDKYSKVEISSKLSTDMKLLKQLGHLMAYKDLSLWLEHEFPDDIRNWELYKRTIQESKKLISVEKDAAAVSKTGKYSRPIERKLYFLGYIDGFNELISCCEESKTM